MENDLFVGQARDLLDEVEQELLEDLGVDEEETEEFVGLFEGDDGEDLEILNVEVEGFEDHAIVRSEDVVSLLAPHNLADGMGFDKQLDELDGSFVFKLHEVLPELDDVLFFLLQGHFYSDILQGMFVILLVLDQNLQIQFIFVLLLGQTHGFFIVIEIFANFDGGLDIEEVAFEGTFG
jgi:hypothetical protein